MLVRTVLGAIAGGALGVVGCGLLPGAHAGAAGGACALMTAAGAMLAVRGLRPCALGGVSVAAIASAATLAGMVCADSRRVLRASDSDVRMALAVQAAADLDAKGELKSEDIAALQKATAPEELPASVVLATERAWERMTLTSRASFRDELTGAQRIARGYLGEFGPLSVVNGRDLIWGACGVMLSSALVGLAGRRPRVRKSVEQPVAAPRLRRAA